MYIDPFVAGVLSTIGVEALAIVAAAVYAYYKEKKDGK